MIEEMQRCVRTKPPHVRIRKWRLTYSQASALAHDIHGMKNPFFAALMSEADILMTIVDGNQYIFNIPVEVKLTPGMAYPIEKPTIRYSQPKWLAEWLK